MKKLANLNFFYRRPVKAALSRGKFTKEKGFTKVIVGINGL